MMTTIALDGVDEDDDAWSVSCHKRNNKSAGIAQ